ncbi:hypothetical protein IQ270_23635 [Microcoleus sp. LEGE 07076]|uniref:hypothetical protein n=1 Tax=Microcoleus sp. LEGE 07076 TaxID=915322 RepID=UPI00187EBD34|nr:hypothetical protein [Microcoleus sp. LEGE 07076]MBE9187556.1 hypothetical protein [Microcoleus sp. LEGE 07076]
MQLALLLPLENSQVFLGTGELESLNFGNCHFLKLLSLPFPLEDTSASTLPLSNLTQIFPDWWADRIGGLRAGATANYW